MSKYSLDLEKIKLVNNKSLLIREKCLVSSITPYKLEIHICDTGEIFFNMFSVLMITNFLELKDGFMELTRMKELGFNDDQLDDFEDPLHTFWWSFDTVVNFCVLQKGSTKFLSAVINYLKSFGSDYFNKWYKKSVNKNMFNSEYSFYEEDADVFYTSRDFTREEDNLCGITGDVYVLQFSTGVVKIGKSKDGFSRVNQHTQEASRYMVTVDKQHIVQHSRVAEEVLIDFCNKHGKCISGKEYFLIDYNLVIEFLKKMEASGINLRLVSNAV